MKGFTVVWSRAAEDELAEIWLTATDQQSISEATNAMDKELCISPMQVGVELTEGLRAVDFGPIRALFEVSVADRIVRVLKIKRVS